MATTCVEDEVNGSNNLALNSKGERPAAAEVALGLKSIISAPVFLQQMVFHMNRFHHHRN